MIRRPAGAALFLVFALSPLTGLSSAPRAVEVVRVEGIIDGPTARAVRAAIAAAERESAEAVVIEVDSPGAVDVTVAERMIEDVRRARVPTISWIGPPGATAERSGAELVLTASLAAMAPGSSIEDPENRSLRPRRDETLRTAPPLLIGPHKVPRALVARPFSAERAKDDGVVDVTAIGLPDLLKAADGRDVVLSGARRTMHTSPDGLEVRFRKLDIPGRIAHAAAKASMTYLLLLLAMVGLVFEVFHPSRGPAGLAGLLALGLAVYGVVVLRASWLGFGLVVAAVVSMSVDLRFEGLGVFTLAGVAALVAGSLELFPSGTLRVSPAMLVVGILGILAFMLGAMTRVLRDLRAVRRGELRVGDPHPH